MLKCLGPGFLTRCAPWVRAQAKLSSESKSKLDKSPAKSPMEKSRSCFDFSYSADLQIKSTHVAPFGHCCGGMYREHPCRPSDAPSRS